MRHVFHFVIIVLLILYRRLMTSHLQPMTLSTRLWLTLLWRRSQWYTRRHLLSKTEKNLYDLALLVFLCFAHLSVPVFSAARCDFWRGCCDWSVCCTGCHLDASFAPRVWLTGQVSPTAIRINIASTYFNGAKATLAWFAFNPTGGLRTTIRGTEHAMEGQHTKPLAQACFNLGAKGISPNLVRVEKQHLDNEQTHNKEMTNMFFTVRFGFGGSGRQFRPSGMQLFHVLGYM